MSRKGKKEQIGEIPFALLQGAASVENIVRNAIFNTVSMLLVVVFVVVFFLSPVS